MPRYATYAQLTAYMASGTAPSPQAEGERQLDRASELLDAALITAVYDTDDDDEPTDADVIDAFVRATCAQVAWWVETGDEQGSSAVGPWANVKIGSVSLSRASSSGQDSGSGGRLAPQVVAILRTAGLLPGVVRSGW